MLSEFCDTDMPFTIVPLTLFTWRSGHVLSQEHFQAFSYHFLHHSYTAIPPAVCTSRRNQLVGAHQTGPSQIPLTQTPRHAHSPNLNTTVNSR
jgi:hypothetical protein